MLVGYMDLCLFTSCAAPSLLLLRLLLLDKTLLYHCVTLVPIWELCTEVAPCFDPKASGSNTLNPTIRQHPPGCM